MPIYIAGPINEQELRMQLSNSYLSSGSFVVINTGFAWCLNFAGYRHWYQWLRYIEGFVLWLSVGRPKSAKDAEHGIHLLEIELSD